MICIAGGSGKAPIRSILYYLRDRGMNRKVKYFFGAKSKRDLYMTEEFLELSKAFPNLSIFLRYLNRCLKMNGKVKLA